MDKDTPETRKWLQVVSWRSLSAIVLVVATLIVGWIVFIRPVGTVDWAVRRLDSHQAQLDEIVQTITANPDICFVSSTGAHDTNCPVASDCYLWSHQPTDTNCPRPVTPDDARDYAKIHAVLSDLSAGSLQLFRSDGAGPALRMELSIFDGSMIPWRVPIGAVWTRNGSIGPWQQGCVRATIPNWFVCQGKMVSL